MNDQRSVRLHPRAADDAMSAYRWYLERNPMIAEIFIAELDTAIARIAESPRRWPRFGDAYRRYLLGRFPFSIIYRETSGHVEVLAVAHHRRRPRAERFS